MAAGRRVNGPESPQEVPDGPPAGSGGQVHLQDTSLGKDGSGLLVPLLLVVRVNPLRRPITPASPRSRHAGGQGPPHALSSPKRGLKPQSLGRLGRHKWMPCADQDPAHHPEASVPTRPAAPAPSSRNSLWPGQACGKQPRSLPGGSQMSHPLKTPGCGCWPKAAGRALRASFLLGRLDTGWAGGGPAERPTGRGKPTGRLRCSPFCLGKEGPGPPEHPPGTEAGPRSRCARRPCPPGAHTPTSGHRAPPSLAQPPGTPSQATLDWAPGLVPLPHTTPTRCSQLLFGTKAATSLPFPVQAPAFLLEKTNHAPCQARWPLLAPPGGWHNKTLASLKVTVSLRQNSKNTWQVGNQGS